VSDWPREVFDRSPVGIAVLDGTGAVLHANGSLGRLLGREPADLTGTPLHDFAIDDDGPFWPGISERRLRQESGHELRAVASAVTLPDSGDMELLVCLDDAPMRQRTDGDNTHADARVRPSDHPDRWLLRDRIETALARSRRRGGSVAVLVIDPGPLDEVNHAIDHDERGEVLVVIASGIQSAMRSCDTVARLGADEFVVVCEELTAASEVEALARRLLVELDRPVQVSGRSVSVSASIGIAVAGPGAESAESAESADQLIRTAYLAMYRAKHQPDTSYVVAGDTDAAELVRGEQRSDGLLADLRHAIQADLLQLHYQPVVRADGGLLGLEALIRWPHPRRGLLMPHDFLPHVAHTDLARPLSDWVLRAAVGDAASLGDPRLRVSVNMRAADVARPGFADTVAMLLRWAGLPSRGLYLELHEHDLPGAGRGLSGELSRLRHIGVGLAIDDVGADGASLAGLGALPVDTLKVGRSFVAGCLSDPEDTVVVATVATAARATGRHAVAAGVENVDQLHLLRGLGYESFQGYLAGAPAPLDDLQDVIARRRVTLGVT